MNSTTDSTSVKIIHGDCKARYCISLSLLGTNKAPAVASDSELILDSRVLLIPVAIEDGQ